MKHSKKIPDLSHNIRVTASPRAEYPARRLDVKIPIDYPLKLKKSWFVYNIDPLIGYLVNRTTEFAVNGMEWQVKDKNERNVWNQWARTINKSAPNILPGLDEVMIWISKHIQVSGISHMHWVWDRMPVMDKKFMVPYMMVIENPLSVSLQRTAEFASEKIFLKGQIDTKEKIKEGIQPEVSTSTTTTEPGVREISALGSGKNEEMFSIKYNYSPGDLTTYLSATSYTTGQAIYPEPPLLPLVPAAVKRQALDAADIAILDGIQNYILIYKVGDKDHQPIPDKYDAEGNLLKKGDITRVKELLAGDKNVRVSELFLPYYIDIDIKTPPIESLLSVDKYIQPTLEIMNFMGIILMPAGRGNERFLEINIANFEERVDFIRKRYIKRFFEAIATDIAERNSMDNIPKLAFNPVNTKNTNFINNILNLTKLGKLSSRTTHEFIGVDHETEVGRIADEIDEGTKEMMDRNTPVSYKQTTVNDGGVTTEINPSLQEGRPEE